MRMDIFLELKGRYRIKEFPSKFLDILKMDFRKSPVMH